MEASEAKVGWVTSKVNEDKTCMVHEVPGESSGLTIEIFDDELDDLKFDDELDDDMLDDLDKFELDDGKVKKSPDL